jgi:hypothetical protein
MAAEPPHRARSLAEFRDAQLKFVEAGMAAKDRFAPFEPRLTDIIISPYGKCGTTLLQQTFHTLRTRGDMDFDDISRVVPWIEMSPMLGIDLNAEQRANPRGFKSHSGYATIPKGARYVVSLRDPKRAFISMFRFMEGWFIEPGAIPIEEYFEHWLKGRGAEGEGYWDHLKSWWAVRGQPNVLLLSYAQMARDPIPSIRRLADFAGIPLDDELLDLTVERTSRAFMLAHKDRFDDAMMRHFSETVAGMPPGSDSAKVRHGIEEALPPAIFERMNAIWAEQITGPLGFADFAELDAAI